MFESGKLMQADRWRRFANRFRDWRQEPDLAGAGDFDAAQWQNIGLSPVPGHRLLGYGERALGQSSELFPRRTNPNNTTPPLTEQLRQWRKMVERLRQYSARGQVAGINAYINELNETAADVAALARSKPWAGVLNQAPWPEQETDRALGKYISLRLLGFHSDRLRLVLADSRFPARPRVILAIFFSGKVFVLSDHGCITTDERLTGFHPSCSVNARQFYLHWDHTRNDTPARAAKRLISQFGLIAG